MVSTSSSGTLDPDNAEEFRLTRRQAACRFGPPAQKEQIRELIDQRIPINTTKTTNWCVSMWNAWSEHGNSRERVTSTTTFVALSSR